MVNSALTHSSNTLVACILMVASAYFFKINGVSSACIKVMYIAFIKLLNVLRHQFISITFHGSHKMANIHITILPFKRSVSARSLNRGSKGRLLISR
jgi:hypothetical protein